MEPSRSATAQWYAGALGPVVLGTHLTASGACSCGNPVCTQPGLHPASPSWRIESTCDVEVVGKWWAGSPAASVLGVTGVVWDVWEVPVDPGMEALLLLELRRRPVGPAAQDGGVLRMWVPAGSSAGPAVRCWGGGVYVPLPVDMSAWVVPPQQRRPLPDPGPLLDEIEAACARWATAAVCAGSVLPMTA